jgi:uncharacterized protein YprB with RNaseH-like and TPR domain
MSIKQKLGLYKPSLQPIPEVRIQRSFGTVKCNELGPYVLERTISTDSLKRGDRLLSDYHPFRVSGILELALVRENHPVHPEDLLFLDTETTGLSRGAGNFPFLVGLGYFENGSLVIRQILMTSPAGEKQFLDAIQEEVRKHSHLVTYNGKSFDIPLIKNRLILQRDRLHPPVLHFDLFHILKRLFPHRRLGRYRQKDLEAELLGFSREDDIEGAQVPQIYFDFVKYGTDTGMEKVIEHNRLDLEGMMLLFLEAVRVYTDLDSSRASLRSGLARILAHNHRYFEALDAAMEIQDLLLDGKEGFHYRDALFRAWLERRAGNYEEAASTYETIAERCMCDYSRLNLVRILEYRLNRPHQAIEHVDILISRAPPPDLPSLARRRARLDMKAKKLDERRGRESSA